MRRPGEGVAGFPMLERNPDGAERWVAKRGLLEGETGIALALLAAVTDVDPAWDRMLLVSGDQR